MAGDRERVPERDEERERWRGQEGRVNWDPEWQGEGIRGRHKTDRAQEGKTQTEEGRGRGRGHSLRDNADKERDLGTWGDLEKQEIEPEIEGEGEGHRDTKKSHKSPGKETETCLRQKQSESGDQTDDLLRGLATWPSLANSQQTLYFSSTFYVSGPDRPDPL